MLQDFFSPCELTILVPHVCEDPHVLAAVRVPLFLRPCLIGEKVLILPLEYTLQDSLTQTEASKYGLW